MLIFFTGFCIIVVICTIWFHRHSISKEKDKQLEAKQKEIQEWKDTLLPENMENDISLEAEAKIEFPSKFITFLRHYLKACKDLGMMPTAQTNILYTVLKNYPPYLKDSVSNIFKFVDDEKDVKIEYTYISKITSKGYKFSFRVEDLDYCDIPYPVFIYTKYNCFEETDR